ncbi:hypothetical protein JOQ06_013201, partial [Pogonophryne albipinna]
MEEDEERLAGWRGGKEKGEHEADSQEWRPSQDLSLVQSAWLLPHSPRDSRVTDGRDRGALGREEE